MAVGIEHSIYRIPQQDLCVSCGICTVACPKRAITESYQKGIFAPAVSRDKCIDCGICADICPSVKIDVKKCYEELELFSNKHYDCYSAYAKDETIRKNGSSGGVVTAIVIELLGNKRYEKAYLLDYTNFSDGSRAHLKAYTLSEISKVSRTAKSKYIPASIDTIATDIKTGSFENAIVVCTPCQLLAIKNLLRHYKRNSDSILYVGLFCDKTLNYNIYKYYADKYGPYEELLFRDKEFSGWPGNSTIVSAHFRRNIDRNVRIALKPYFQLHRCSFCFDKLNQLADISVGDCYSSDKDIKGVSSVILRTPLGKEIWKACEQVLISKTCDYNEIVEVQSLDKKQANLLRNVLEDGCYKNIDVSKINLHNYKNEGKEYQLGASYSTYKDIDKCAIDFQKRQGFVDRVIKKCVKYMQNKRRKHILIDSKGFENKGDELMLYAVIQQIQLWEPQARIVVPEKVFKEKTDYFARNGILPFRSMSKIHPLRNWFSKFKSVLAGKRFVYASEIDLLLDDGGFQFGDQWEYSDVNIEQKVLYYKEFTKKNHKIVLLPQAFGPFTKGASITMMKSIDQYIDLYFARETTSYENLTKVVDSAKVKICPDFTLLYKPQSNRISLPEKEYVVIIPNVRMLTHASSKTSNSYMSFFSDIIQYLNDKDEKVILLNHEGEDDWNLISEINNNLSQPVIAISDISAVDVKSIIRQSKLLISSRYHGVVNGLVQNVPTLCTSWSHKYETLLEEHQCKDSMLMINDIAAAKKKISDALTNPGKYTSKGDCIAQIENEVMNMWHIVFREL